MVDGAFTAGLMAAQEGLLAGAILTACVTAALAVWLRVQRQRTVTSLARHTQGHGSPDPCDPAVGLARLRFAQGEIDSEELRRILQALSRQWQA